MSLIWHRRAALNTPWNLKSLNPHLWIDGDYVAMYDATKIQTAANMGSMASPTQATPANMPTIVTASANFGGHDAIAFGATQGLFAASFAIGSPLTIIAALRIPGVSLSANRTWLGSTTGPLTGINYVNTLDKFYMYDPANVQAVGAPQRPDAAVIVSCRWVKLAPTMRLSSSLSTIYTGTMPIELAYPGLSIGCASDLSRSLLGEIQTLAIFPGGLSDTDEKRAIRWLGDHCKITVTA